MQEELAVKNQELADAGVAADEKLKLMLVDQAEAKEKKEKSETLSVEVKAREEVIQARRSEAGEATLVLSFTAFPCVSLPFLAVPLPSQRTVANRGRTRDGRAGHRGGQAGGRRHQEVAGEA
eukprot:SAG22_NODE_657_length_8082_cov_7.277590_8_plen_122_part_00